MSLPERDASQTNPDAAELEPSQHRFGSKLVGSGSCRSRALVGRRATDIGAPRVRSR